MSKAILLVVTIFALALVTIGQSQISNSSVNEFSSLIVDGKSVVMIDPSNELQTSLPIF
jgi:hypothetical protein